MLALVAAASAFAALAGCSSYDSVTHRIAQSITPYRITIVQGNFVSSEAAAQMQPGMTRDQVRQLLGTPLLTDMFHQNRWDYVFYMTRGSSRIVERRDFIVYFDGDRVSSWVGSNDLPSNLELLAEIDGDRNARRLHARQSAAAAAAAASEAETNAIGPTVTDPVRSTSPGLGEATQALPSAPNVAAADAANRAVNTMQVPSGQNPGSRISAPQVSNGAPLDNSNLPQQLQLHHAAPDISLTPENPVGPTSGDSGGSGSTLDNFGPSSPSEGAPSAPPSDATNGQ
jgi:outer membrane protein assembly factor BamE